MGGVLEGNGTVSAPKIFKAYDIRGVYGDELDEGIAYLVGRAVTSYLNATRILVGRDMRTSSIPLRDALVRGIMDQGADVVDIGLCSTPMFYWATQHFEAGVMVTASHNPAKYNGFKICKNGAFPVGELSGMKEIEALVLAHEFPQPSRKGSYSTADVLKDFLSFNLSFLKTNRSFRVVIDAGNGMGGYTYAALMKRLPKGITIIPMFFEPDGRFPNHEANPLKQETCRQLQERVIAEKADLGVALDGDEDRVFFIDEHGEFLPSDFTTALVAQQVLSEHNGAKILYGICQSRIVPEAIVAAGGTPVMSKVGHANYKVLMKEIGAAWGGEHSGHYFNAEQQNTENTQIIFFRLLNLLAHEGKPFSEVVKPLRKYAKIPETNFETHKAREVMALLEAKYGPAAQSISKMDGLRIDFLEWWFVVRPSNTEPVLRLNLEAKNEQMMNEKLEELRRIITG
jgi:phosphomannomutase